MRNLFPQRLLSILIGGLLLLGLPSCAGSGGHREVNDQTDFEINPGEAGELAPMGTGPGGGGDDVLDPGDNPGGLNGIQLTISDCEQSTLLCITRCVPGTLEKYLDGTYTAEQFMGFCSVYAEEDCLDVTNAMPLDIAIFDLVGGTISCEEGFPKPYYFRCNYEPVVPISCERDFEPVLTPF